MTRVITTTEVQKHKKRDSLWLIIHDDVYDVTKFIEEHPGGEDTLLDAGGFDATQAFEDVGHSEDARELLKKYKIGTLSMEEKSSQKLSKTGPSCCKMRKNSFTNCNSVTSCLSATSKQSKKSWRTFDNPSDSNLTSKGTRATRIVVPPDKCDEPAIPTAATKRIVCCDDKSTQIKPKKKVTLKKKTIEESASNRVSTTNWKLYALAAVVVGSIVAGVIAYKKTA